MASILKTLQDRLAAMSWDEVQSLADASGVSVHTIAKIKRGETDDPRVRTVEDLMAHIKRSRKPVNAA